jgi:hypothetical protein
MDGARAEADGLLALDAGDLFLPPANRGPGLLPPDPGEVERRGRLLAAALGRMGLAAFTPGERDLALGVPSLRRLLGAAKIPIVSANLFDRGGRRVFDADRVVEIAGVKVGLFGIIKALPEDAADWKAWGLEARDPAAAARAEVAALRARGATIVIALLHTGPIADTRKLLADAPGIDWAVLGHTGMNLDEPEQAGGARMLEAMTMGKHVGQLDLHIVGGDTTAVVDRGRRAQVATILADHQRQLADTRQRVAETTQPGQEQQAMRKYHQQRAATLEKSIARETELLRSLPAEVKGSWFENRIIPLDAAIADHPGVALLIADYNRENRRRALAGKLVGLFYRVQNPPSAMVAAHAAPLPAAAEPADADVRYTGTVTCGNCHQPALAFWQTTKHARALDTLVKRKRDQDPTCVGCHVTGFLRPGGTRDVTVATGRLRDVGCESCHGGGIDHVTADNKKTGVSRKVPEAVCLGCHTRDQTNGEFDYATFLKAILGPGHGAGAAGPGRGSAAGGI